MKPNLFVITNIDVYIVAVADQIAAHVHHYQWPAGLALSIPTRLVWLVLYLLSSTAAIYATSIVAIRTDKMIVIAADSKGTTKALILGVNSEPSS